MYLCVYEWWHVCTVYVCKCYECKLINEAKGLKVMRLYFKTNLCSNIKKIYANNSKDGLGKC